MFAGARGEAMPATATVALSNPLLGDEYLSEDQAAEFLGWSRRTLYRRYLERSGPPRITIGRKVMYKRASLLAWLDANERHQVRATSGNRTAQRGRGPHKSATAGG